MPKLSRKKFSKNILDNDRFFVNDELILLGAIKFLILNSKLFFGLTMRGVLIMILRGNSNFQPR